ncbi:golgi family to endosome transport protein [Ophiostoma piceae UAMH 11346]|uniref:Golgi family to endosome transport protein n=1 Tax=Ophiostoma piceae (strain UAMH 11346) TaxID=1262450 RepID=S3C9M2_OPHP1|nr:golgi family to endosome transport protein [Ophiostoma piceae UAMH 11346]
MGHWTLPIRAIPPTTGRPVLPDSTAPSIPFANYLICTRPTPAAMDFNNLKDAVSNLTLYDIKANVRKVQNAVMNYTEMEAKVREATNNEPWGASSTLMQEIANGTFNYQTLNEIMPMLYRRFTEKAAEEWRQIYKSLQLLEFLIKHGSERVIDDARSHLTLLKMLRQFHFIDQNEYDEYDEGESRPSRTGTKRTTGGTPSKKTASSSSSSRAAPSAPPKPKPKAPEVDLFSFDDPVPSTTAAPLAAAPAAGAAANDEDDFDDFQSAPTPAAAPAASAFGGLGGLGGLGSLSTPPLTTSNASGAQFAAPQPVSGPKQANLTDMMGISSISPPPASGANYSAFYAPPPAQQQQAPQQQASQPQRAASGYQPTQPNYYQSVVTQPGQAPKSVFPSSTSSAFGSTSATPSVGGMAALRPAVAAAPAAAAPAKVGGDAFGSLWSTASTGIKKAPTGGPGPSMGQLAQEKSQAAIWGAPAASTPSAASKPAPSGGLDDLLG